MNRTQVRIPWMSRAPRARVVWVGVLTVGLSGCFWTAPNNDAGQDEWVIDTLRVLHGRAPRSMGEVSALASLATHNGRGAVVELLLNDAEMVEHWSRVLTDDLGVERSGQHMMSNACYGDPLLTPARQVALAAHLRTAPTNQPFCVPGVDVDVPIDDAASALRLPGPPYMPKELEQLGVSPPPTEAEAERTLKALEGDGDRLAKEALDAGERSAERGAADGGEFSRRWIASLPAPSGASQEIGFDHAMRVSTSADIAHEWIGAAEDGEAAAREAEAAARDAEIAAREAEAAAREADAAARAPEDGREPTRDPVAGGDAKADGSVEDAAGEPADADAAARDFPMLMVCPQFNMTDVIRAGILGKSLWVAWRGQLVPNQVFADTGDINDRDRIAMERFYTGWLGRDTSCLACHTSTYSTSEARPRNGEWDRFHPPTGTGYVDVDVEGSALSLNMGTGEMYGGSGGNYWWLRRLFRADVLKPGVNTNGHRPWNMSPVCTNLDGVNTDHSGFLLTVPADPLKDTAFGGLGPSNQITVIDLINEVPEIINGFSLYSSPMGPQAAGGGNAASGAGDYSSFCLGCHDTGTSSGLAPALDDVIPYLPDSRLFQVIKHGSMSMPQQGAYLSDSEIWDVIAHMRSLPGYNHQGPKRYTDPEDGIAHLLAQQIVNRVVEDIQGYPLVLSHGFPRNPAAADLLDNLSRVFVQSGWSLQALLRYIVLTNAFNRAAPAEGPYAYEVQMVANPWAGEPPAATPPADRNHNGTGDLVHRSNIPAMFRHVHEALGWPEAATVGDTTLGPFPFPARSLQLEVGRPLGVERFTGQPAVELDNLLRWERLVASCVKPGVVRAADVQVAVGVTVPPNGELTNSNDWIDWIDVLAASSLTGTAEDVVRAIKVRLISDPEVSPTEAPLYASLLGVADLTVPASTVTETAMRRACGVLMETPDFMLRRLPNVTPAVAPAWEVCLEPACTRAQFCSTYTPQLVSLGYNRDCNGNIVAIVDDAYVSPL